MVLRATRTIFQRQQEVSCTREARRYEVTVPGGFDLERWSPQCTAPCCLRSGQPVSSATSRGSTKIWSVNAAQKSTMLAATCRSADFSFDRWQGSI